MSDLGFRQPVLLYLPGVVAMEIRGPPEGSSPWHLILIMPEPTCESFVSCMILWVVAAERALDASTADHYLNFASRLSILSSEITFYMYCGCSDPMNGTPNHSQKIRQKIHHWQFTTKGRSRLLWMLLQTTWRDSRMALCRVLGWWTSGRFLSRTIGIHVIVIYTKSKGLLPVRFFPNAGPRVGQGGYGGQTAHGQRMDVVCGSVQIRPWHHVEISIFNSHLISLDSPSPSPQFFILDVCRFQTICAWNLTRSKAAT